MSRAAGGWRGPARRLLLGLALGLYEGLGAIGSIWFPPPPPEDLEEPDGPQDGLPGPGHPERLLPGRPLTRLERRLSDEITSTHRR